MNAINWTLKAVLNHSPRGKREREGDDPADTGEIHEGGKDNNTQI